MTREEKVARLTKDLLQGGWSSVYSFVDSHADDNDLEDEEDYEEDDED